MGSPPKRIIVAINPNASFGATRHVGPAVVAALRAGGHDAVPLSAPDFDGLVRIARAAVSDTARPADALVVVGGDGMVNLGVNLVAGTSVPLGIIPAGTGNDFAGAVGVPTGDIDAAITHLLAALDSGPRTVDAARVSGEALDEPRWFAGVLSAGFDARVNERANGLRFPKGASRYVLALVAELITLKSRRYTLVIDGETVEVDSCLLSVANNTTIGGGMRIAPDARLDDGLLDVFIVKPVSRLRFIRLFPKVFSGTHVGLPVVEFRRGRTVSVAASDIVGYADGERFGELPLTVELVPGALRVLA
ncbi:diacylglycerol kinase family protein [Herbiconiux sp. KACC 21604]|uniref:diacylglycerol/lipid kinase family protein n=1 Tax=unclassified Herbiconiux TaxID=2618217 RepID=UPI001490EE6A|nr:diacylglycerol kinase family protein [Herbiconiux sp. SALV-R1]QJU54093.1 diacylglycerol kinase [Herbiconiux sp. SALV-R1]WPO85139.1 diacylglycerol kinase family protein [Herbiconiux sp. KACC 21604]